MIMFVVSRALTKLEDKMELADFESYIAAERERRKTPREREIERQLQEIAAKHREALVAELEPLFNELAEIEARKQPLPIMIDGVQYEYTGKSVYR